MLTSLLQKVNLPQTFSNQFLKCKQIVLHLLNQKSLETKRWLSLSFNNQGFTLVDLQKLAIRQWEVANMAYYPLKTQEEFPEKIRELVNTQGLSGVACVWVLQPSEYQVFLIDMLDVKPEELHAALRWRLKELIRFPLEDAIFDFVVISNHTASRQRDKLYVTVTQLSAVNRVINALRAAKLEVMTMDIAELALRNLMSFFSKPNRSYAFVRLDTSCLEASRSYILITRNNDLQLVRHLELNLTPLTKSVGDSSREGLMNEILLEIQRTYDYCISELNIDMPEKLFLCPRFSQETDFMDFLKQHLSSDVFVINMKDILVSREPIEPAVEADCFIALGGALRQFASEYQLGMSDATN